MDLRHSSTGRWLGLATLAGLTKLERIHPYLPERVRDRLLLDWTHEMLRAAVLGRGVSIYADIPCAMNPSLARGRKCEVEGPQRLTEDELDGFWRDGILGPITLMSPEEMAERRAAILAAIRERPSEVYAEGRGCTRISPGDLPRAASLEAIATRDRHLDCPEIWALIAQAAVRERLAQLLGPDLVVWRSQLFDKRPGHPGVNWHVESCFVTDNAATPALAPRRLDELFQLTVWVALDDTDVDNGCLHFIPGSYHRLARTRLLEAPPRAADGDDTAWWRMASIATVDHPSARGFPICEADYAADRVRAMPLRAGQCVVFSGRGVHGSPPNRTSDRRRTGINFRVLRADVDVVNCDEHRDFHAIQTRFDTSRWGVAPLRGDPGLRNRVRTPRT